MHRRNLELRLASLAVLLITILYIGVILYLGSIPAASGLFGHSIGILGFILMLITETLYSLRKRSRKARWGTMSSWLQFHIFTGIVGPYLVLLHTSWKFNGLAGLLILLTMLIVLSGFIGRYIYTAVPRSVDGLVIEVSTLEREIIETNDALTRLLASHNQFTRITPEQVAEITLSQGELRPILGRALDEFRARLFWRRLKLQLPPSLRKETTQLETLLTRQRILRRQVASLSLARRLLAKWHAIHIPIGMALFTISIIHIFAAIYYANLL